jgi:hypothetical protein
MVTRRVQTAGWCVASCVAILWCGTTALAQGVDPGKPMNMMSRKGSAPTVGEGGVSGDAPVGPYGRQIYCPITGNKLGVKQPAIPVQTAIGEKKASFVGGIFGKKATSGVVIYVCCPACAEKVRQNPEHYLGVVINDTSAISTRYTYETAPPLKPQGPER